MQKLSGRTWVGPGVALERCGPRGWATGARPLTGSPWWGGGFQGPGVSSGTADGRLVPRHPLLSVRTARGWRVPPCVHLPRPRSGCWQEALRCLTGEHVWGWGQDVGSLCLPGRPQRRSLARGLGELCSLSSRVSGSRARGPQLAPSCGSPSRGGSAVVCVCRSGHAADRGGVTAELAGPGWPPSDWKQPHVGVPGPWGHLRAVSPPGQLGAHLRA